MVTTQELRKSLAPCVPYPLQDLLTRAAGSYGRRVAVIDGNSRFTYEQLSEYSAGSHRPWRSWESARATVSPSWRTLIELERAGHSSTMLEWTMLDTRSSLTLCHGSGAMQLVR